MAQAAAMESFPLSGGLKVDCQGIQTLGGAIAVRSQHRAGCGEGRLRKNQRESAKVGKTTKGKSDVDLPRECLQTLMVQTPALQPLSSQEWPLLVAPLGCLYLSLASQHQH